ncbi:MAG: SMC family ATPase, partial [Thaumarchaeota archaeon S15]
MMIIEVKLVNFLSHKDTSIQFGTGMNVILGPNGAGKSSIVDAITFALFGKHLRDLDAKKNKILIRHGALSGHVEVIFEAGGRKYKATRKLKSGVVATHILYEWHGEKWNIIATGERKQMGESTTREIESIVQSSFEKIQIASIIKQNELADIVHEKAKNFKILI